MIHRDITKEIRWVLKKDITGLYMNLLGKWQGEFIVIFNGTEKLHRYYRCQKQLKIENTETGFRISIRVFKRSEL